MTDRRRLPKALALAAVVALASFAYGFSPPQGGSGGGGVSNPLTGDLDANGHSITDAGGFLDLDSSGGAYLSNASENATIYAGSDDRLLFYADGGSMTLGPDGLTMASGKGITGGTLTWTSWTPTGSWTANTTYAGYYCVVGKMLFLRVTVTTSGAPTSTNLTITNLPGSYVADETAMLSPTTGSTLGMGTIIDSGTTNYGYVMARWSDASNVIPVVCLNTTAGQFQNVTQSFPMVWGATDQLQFTAMVPIQ